MDKIKIAASRRSHMRAPYSARIIWDDKDLGDIVRKKAYELYEKRGKRPGRAMDDWLEAERLIRNKAV